MPNTPETAQLTPKMLALLFDTDSKTIRRFLRNLLATDNHPGKGNRWMIDPNALDSLKIHFDAYLARRTQTISIDMISPPAPATAPIAKPARKRASKVITTQLP